MYQRSTSVNPDRLIDLSAPDLSNAQSRYARQGWGTRQLSGQRPAGRMSQIIEHAGTAWKHFLGLEGWNGRVAIASGWENLVEDIFRGIRHDQVIRHNDMWRSRSLYRECHLIGVGPLPSEVSRSARSLGFKISTALSLESEALQRQIDGSGPRNALVFLYITSPDQNGRGLSRADYERIKSLPYANTPRIIIDQRRALSSPESQASLLLAGINRETERFGPITKSIFLFDLATVFPNLGNRGLACAVSEIGELAVDIGLQEATNGTSRQEEIVFQTQCFLEALRVKLSACNVNMCNKIWLLLRAAD